MNSKSEFGHNRVPRIRIEMGNTILRGERAFEGGKTREELEKDIIEDEDMDEGEKEYEKIWGVAKKKMKWEKGERERGVRRMKRMGEPEREEDWRREKIERYGK